LLVAWLLVACGTGASPVALPPLADAGALAPDAHAVQDSQANDSQVPDAQAFDSTTGPDPDATRQLPPTPAGRLDPVPGEVSIHVLDLPVGIAPPRMGIALVVIGPDGSVALLDIGNKGQAKAIREHVESLNTTWLTPARGYPARTVRQVEWVVLGHDHADHLGSFEELLLEKNALEVTRGIVHRGHVDLGPGANLDRWQTVCQGLASTWKHRDVPLCHAAMTPACGPKPPTAPAIDCPGLRGGDLGTAQDDAAGKPGFLELGGGARLTVLAANAWLRSPGATVSPAACGHQETNEENARSLVLWLEHGRFRALLGGDLSGSGQPGEPDIETPLLQAAGPWLLPAGADVTMAHHHGRKTSSNAGFVAAMAPADGLDRNVFAALNEVYLASPHEEVVQRWTAKDRLGKGRFWLPRRAVGGAKPVDFPALVVADGELRLRTDHKGAAYHLQAWGKVAQTRTFASVRP